MEEKSKKFALRLSGFLGFVVPTYFAWTIYQTHAPQNIATWAMTLVLDALGLILVVKAGNKKPYLQIGWVLAATCIMAAIFFGDNPWSWGYVETISSILAIIAVVVWLTKSAKDALLAYVAAMYFSFVPLMINYWRNPQPETSWVWLWTMATCLLVVYGEKRDFVNIFVPCAALVMNAVITMLCYL